VWRLTGFAIFSYKCGKSLDLLQVGKFLNKVISGKIRLKRLCVPGMGAFSLQECKPLILRVKVPYGQG
jgi:hypothetical protein